MKGSTCGERPSLPWASRATELDSGLFEGNWTPVVVRKKAQAGRGGPCNAGGCDR